jgi:hypothetical protein
VIKEGKLGCSAKIILLFFPICKTKINILKVGNKTGCIAGEIMIL